MSIDGVALRPVAEPDLPVMERFLIDPETVAPFQWWGWSGAGGASGRTTVCSATTEGI
jgi:hypothetical protein